MSHGIVKWLLVVSVGLACKSCLVGCGPQMDKTVGVAGLPSEYQPIVGVLVKAIQDQGVLDKWMVNGRVRGQRPGIETHFTSDNSVGIRLSGIALEAEGEAGGEGYAHVPGEIMQFVLDRAKNGDADAAALLRTWFAGRAEWTPRAPATSQPAKK